MKPQTKKRLKLFLVLYLVIMLVAAVGTLGWFVFNRDVNVKNGVSVTTGNYLRVALWNGEAYGDYGEQVSFTPEEQANLKDISSKDGQNFYWPQMLLDEEDEPPEDAAFTKIDDENCEGYYIVFDLSLRATEAMDVYLGAASTVTPVETVTGQELYDRQSLYGQISADAIAGAARIAILEVTEDGGETETLKQIWAPNPNYRLYYEEGEAKLDLSGGYETYSYYAPTAEDPNVIEEFAYAAEDYLNYLNVGTNGLATPATAVKGGETTPAMANSSHVLCHFDSGDEVKHLRVRIWFEGTDREADKALNGGLVNYSLQLVGISRDACPDDREAALEKVKGEWATGGYKLFYDENGNNTYQGTDGEKWVNDKGEDGAMPYGTLLYSTNGRDWGEIDPTAGTDGHSFGAGTYYIKFRETATEKESEWRKLELPVHSNG